MSFLCDTDISIACHDEFSIKFNIKTSTSFKGQYSKKLKMAHRLSSVKDPASHILDLSAESIPRLNREHVNIKMYALLFDIDGRRRYYHENAAVHQT